MKNILIVSILCIVMFGNFVHANFKDLTDQKSIAKLNNLILPASLSTIKIDLKSIKFNKFYNSPRNALFTILNNAPSSTPPIVLEYMSCIWTYMLNGPQSFPLIVGGDTIATDLNIQPGQVFTIDSAKMCVIHVTCTLKLKIAGTNATRNLGKDLIIPRGDCLEVVNGKLVNE